MTLLKNIATQYFAAFSNKDTPSMSPLLADGIKLKDWQVEVNGKASVLQANQNIFDSVRSISVTSKLLMEEFSVVVAQLEILINEEELISVVDILHFDNELKICSVTAFKG